MAVKYVPENVEFLTDWKGFELPKGILNKGVTGCGATSVAIEDEHKTIICSPRINLIKNKVGQHKGLLGYRERISYISNFRNNVHISNIFTEYYHSP